MPEPAVRIRMYRQGLGDCFLLSFPKSPTKVRPGDPSEFHMLIDCGVLTGTEDAQQRICDAVSDIFLRTGGRLDLVVATHEHWDHVSGFLQAQSLFDKFQIDQAWLAWTEDPANARAQALHEYQQERLSALQAAVQRMDQASLREDRENIEQILGFFGLGAGEVDLLGASGGKTARAAMAYLPERADCKVHYCYPDHEPPHVFEEVFNVRVYVFGPPEDLSLLKMSDPTRKGKETYGSAALRPEDSFFASVLQAVPGSNSSNLQALCNPFEGFYHIPFEEARSEPFFQKMYGFDPQDENAWRRIDQDWLSVTGDLALNLDSDTNNTSLVLAIEVGEPGKGKVLLFPADAQVGNWLSWGRLSWSVQNSQAKSETVTAPDLLARTVFYKVGHHGSHNATLREAGLEQMTSEELVAMLPVERGMAQKKRWNMPFPDLFARLQQKTRGRVICLDTGLPAREDAHSLTNAQWEAFLEQTRQTDLYVEYCIF